MAKKDDFDLFVSISVSLTGFNEMELWGTTMMEEYYEWVKAQYLVNKDTSLGFFFGQVDAIFAKVGNNEAALHEAIQQKILGNKQYATIAKNIITLWYTGNWPTDNGLAPISARAYTQGVIWNTAQAHPPGAKQPGFGSWNIPPVNN